MVCFPHEAIPRIFQTDPGLFARTAQALGIPFADATSGARFPAGLTRDLPFKVNAESLVRIDSPRSYVLAIEVLDHEDPEKLMNWSCSLAHLYAKYRWPPILAVICLNSSTSVWAARQLNIGTAEWRTLALRPVVLGPDNVPVITDPDQVAQDIPMAILSAVLHQRNPAVQDTLAALASAVRGAQRHDQGGEGDAEDENTAEVFIELTAQGLDKSRAAAIWRRHVVIDTSFFKSSISEELRDEGRAQGLAEGMARGMTRGVSKGLAEGMTRAKAEDILLLLARRGIEISPYDRADVKTCTDLAVLQRWFDRAITATSAADVFSVPDAEHAQQ